MDKGYFAMDKPGVIRNNHNEYVPSEGISNTMARSLSDPFDQPPAYTNDYLTPTNPETHKAHAQPPDIPAFPAGGFSRSQSSVTSNSEESRQVPRADSGIEADFRRGQLSSTGSEYPRSSTIYECIDSNPNYVDPSPQICFTRGRSTEGGSGSSAGVSPPVGRTATAPWPASVASDSEDGGLDDDVRRRLHPVYNSLNQSTPQLYSPTCSCSKDSPGSTPESMRSCKHHRCLCCGLAVLTILTVLLLAIVAYILVFLVPGMQSHIRAQEDDIKRMDLEYQNLSQKVDALLLSTPLNKTTTASKISGAEGVADKIAALNDSVREFGSQMQELGADLQLQINSISRVPDLKGVRGVVNLDGCLYYNASTTTALPGPDSSTSWLPETGSDKLTDYVVMSVTCGIRGGTRHFVETNVLSPSRVQYRCVCQGRVDSSHDRRKCHIHLVLCPRELSVGLLPPS